MKTYKLAVLKGDGIGPEVIDEALKVLKSITEVFDIHFELEESLIGACAIDATGNPLPAETLKKCKTADAVLLGAIGDPKYDNDPNSKVRPEQGLLQLRKSLGLFANVRPLKIYPGLKHLSPLRDERLKGVDFIIFRELTGGIYFGEKGGNENEAYDICSYNKDEIIRIAKQAFILAQKRTRKICLVDKANVLETSRLWRKTIQLLSGQYPDVQVDYMFVDNAAMQLILNPAQFDVILTSNMFGDILSDEASVLAGSIGLLASSSFGEDYRLYEPVHGSYPQAKGKNIANPIASILSVEMMLRDLNCIDAANAIAKAVDNCIEENYLTMDLGADDPVSCSDIGDYISKQIVKYHTTIIY